MKDDIKESLRIRDKTEAAETGHGGDGEWWKDMTGDHAEGYHWVYNPNDEEPLSGMSIWMNEDGTWEIHMGQQSGTTKKFANEQDLELFLISNGYSSIHEIRRVAIPDPFAM